MIPALQVSNVTKIYGNKKVVNNVSFSIYPGQIYGFVGPNGAGKSTTIRMITGLIEPNEGNIKISGYSVEKSHNHALSLIGAVIETPQLYPYLSGLKNLQLFAKFYGKKAMERIPQIVQLVGMEKRINDKVSTYSLGMKQRLGIAQALLNHPSLLILDEPTNGLDPNGIVEMRNVLRVLAEKEKIAILISSHNLAELEQLCDVIGIINNGQMIQQHTMHDIKEMVTNKQQFQLLCNYPNYAALCVKQKYKITGQVIGNSVILPVKEANIAVVIAYLTSKRVKIYGVKKIHKSLEQLYFEILQSNRPSTSIF